MMLKRGKPINFFAYIVTIIVIASVLISGCKTTTETEVPAPTSEQVSATEPPIKPTEPPVKPTEALVVEEDEFTLLWAYERGPSELDPHDPRGTPDNEIVSYLTHNSLARLTVDNPSLVEPDIAKSWDISEDGKIYTFHLRDDVYFWDDWGQMTADDVVFSIERVMTNEALSAHGKVFRIKSVSAIDEFTVEIQFDEPYPSFLATLAANYATAVISKDAYETLGAEGFRLNPIGTGPYKIESWDPGGEASFVANEEYFRGEPEIKGIKLIVQADEAASALALQKGEVNFLVVRGSSMWQALKNVGGITINNDPSISTNTLLFWVNTNRPGVDDARVRKALILALDRQAMADTIGEGMNGGVAHSFIPRSVFGHTEDVTQYPYDPEQARALLEEAGYANGLDLVAITHRSGVYVPVLEAAQAYWAQIGVNLQVEVVERLERGERLDNGDFDINVMDVGRMEPSEWLGEYFYSENLPPTGRAYTRFIMPELDQLIIAQSTESDPEERENIIHEAQKLLMDELPVIPLWYLVNVTAYSDFLDCELPNLYTWNTRFDQCQVER